MVAEIFKLDKKLVIPISKRQLNITPRPFNLSLSNKKIKKILKIEINLQKMISDIKIKNLQTKIQ